MAPQSGTPRYTESSSRRDGDRGQQLADLHDRLSAALDVAESGGAFVGSQYPAELQEVLSDVLALTGEVITCPYGCAERGFRCPVTEPLEVRLAGVRRAGGGWAWDPDKAKAACDTTCVCGSAMAYLAPAPRAGDAHSWAVCVLCRHWMEL